MNLEHQDKKTTMNRKRTKSQNSQSDTSDSDTNTDYCRQQTRRNLNTYATECNPTIVIIVSPDVKLAQINPIKIAKAINSIGKNIIKNVSKTTQGGISVKCHTSGLATKLKAISQLGQWSVTTEFAKSETQSKGVISRIPPELSDQEILLECKQMGVTDACRLMYKRNGQTGKSLSVCLTFNTPNMPRKVQLGYEIVDVKPYIPPVIRCFNCQRLGHVASACRSKIRCVRS